MEEEENHREKLEKHRVDIVQTLDLQRQFVFCYLRSKSVLDEEDCERIVEAGAGRQQKVSKFLDVLACKGPEGYRYFVESLEYEHPALYEKLTGKTAVKRPTKDELFDFDRQYLAMQLEKTTADLQMLTYVHSKMVQEKCIMEQKITETTNELVNEQIQTKELREEMRNISAETLRSYRKPAQTLQPAQQYLQELIAENADKSNRIIHLQQSLLEAVAKAENDKIAVDQLQYRQEGLLQQIRDLTINYDWERRNSRKMGEKICRQSDQIRQGDDLRREIFELKLRLADMQEQRDDAREELREFRNVTEALNAKFDTVRQEKDMAIGFKENFSGTVLELDEQVESLQLKLRKTNLDKNELERKYARQNQELTTMREQRNVLLAERQVAIQERISALKERDEALKMNQELQSARDEAVAAQIKINNSIHEDYVVLEREMESLRGEFNDLAKEHTIALDKLDQAEKAQRLAPFYRALSAPLGSSPCENTAAVQSFEKGQNGSCVKSEVPKSKEEANEKPSTNKPSTDKPYPWKMRSNSSVLNSAYRRINEANARESTQHRASMPVLFNACEADNFERIIGPYKIKDKQRRPESPDTIYFSADNEAIGKPSASQSLVSQNEKNIATGKEANLNVEPEAEKQTATEASPKSNFLSVNRHSTLGKSKAKSAPPSPNQRNSTEVLSCIVPCISDLSVNVAMKSGSSENLAVENNNQKSGKMKKSDDKATVALMKSTINGGLLTCAKQSPKPLRKDVAPKLLYKISKETGNEAEQSENTDNSGGSTRKIASFNRGTGGKSNSLEVSRRRARRHSSAGVSDRKMDLEGLFHV